MTQPDKYLPAIEMMDRANARDPRNEQVNGVEYAKELVYAQRMTDILKKFRPEASEELKLAARCQHIERWKIPRDDFPAGRSGYLRWRNSLKKYHADRAGEILKEAGYGKEAIDRVRKLVLKEGIKTDPEVQDLEDVICLVFLGWYFADLATKHDDEKLVHILRKTLTKMSAEGRHKAVEIRLTDHCRKLLETAMRQHSHNREQP